MRPWSKEKVPKHYLSNRFLCDPSVYAFRSLQNALFLSVTVSVIHPVDQIFGQSEEVRLVYFSANSTLQLWAGLYKIKHFDDSQGGVFALLSQLCVSLLQTKFKYSVLRVSVADPEKVKLKLNLFTNRSFAFNLWTISLVNNRNVTWYTWQNWLTERWTEKEISSVNTLKVTQFYFLDLPTIVLWVIQHFLKLDWNAIGGF